ncbi:hypothetical protein ACFL6I_04420 [candidate division KSB1 bacterium]
MKNRLEIVLLIMLLMLIAGCGGGNLGFPDEPEQPLKAKQLVDSGWLQYELGNYNAAITLFNDAKKADASYLDSYNGLGWSYFRVHNLILSLFNFRIPLDTDSTLTDVQAGYAIAAFEKNEYNETISAIVSVVTHDSVRFDLEGTDEYFFSHDTNVTSRKIRKIFALAYYYSGLFDESYFQLVTFLDPLTNIDPLADDFLEELLRRLEEA